MIIYFARLFSIWSPAYNRWRFRDKPCTLPGGEFAAGDPSNASSTFSVSRQHQWQRCATSTHSMSSLLLPGVRLANAAARMRRLSNKLASLFQHQRGREQEKG
ncbi:hypothetical protein KCP71_02930 [Salmonella enterica subsp. enterica]|nr:hypothetical protein KCP71_02930 [Salmonella enterica subsp. enterica]